MFSGGGSCPGLRYIARRVVFLEPLQDVLLPTLDLLSEILRSNGLTLIQIQHQNFFLADMSDFQKANAVYSSYFGTSPPSRACVAVSLPDGKRVALEAVGYDDSQLSSTDGCRRTALHVQSLSYWAPANIGPYSQAVTVRAGHNFTRLARGLMLRHIL
jgi:diphthine-ammonia ligase